MSAMRCEIEKFDGRMNFALWQVQVKDVLIQSGLHKVLQGKSVSGKNSGKAVDRGDSEKSKISDEEWEELDMRAASQIRMCLAKNVLANVLGLSTTKELWEKLEELYQGKNISNRLYLKEQFHTLKMEEGTKLSDHLSVLNGIVSELETLGVRTEDEDKALRLILSLPSTYEHMKPVLKYGSKELVYADVVSKLITEERRLNDMESKSYENSALSVGSRKKNKGSGKRKVVCWGCGQTGHVRKDCPNGGAESARSSNVVAANVISRGEGDDEFSL